MSVTLLFLSFFAKFLAFFSCLTKRGSGTALPGYIVETKFINILAKFQHEYEEIIFISGTNGKTTTRAVLVEMYENSGFRVCTNRGGANIIRGIASSILLDLDIKAKPKSQILILEVEEASLPILTLYLQPKILILTNLFRDQLDAYAEIDKTLSYFEETLVNLGANEKEPLEVSNLPILEGFTQDGFYTQKLVKAAKFTLYLN
jgi:UDP-N-acetylmuramyl tripeptide synthase